MKKFLLFTKRDGPWYFTSFVVAKTKEEAEKIASSFMSIEQVQWKLF